MTQSMENADCGDHIDRISDVPCNVIDDILKHLNIQDLVRTSILSRNWRYMWISVPQLKFNEKFFYMCEDNHHNGPEISRIIMKVLMLHKGPLHKFTLRMPMEFMYRIDCLEKLILFLSKSGIKDLTLLNLCFRRISYQMPSDVFSLKELTNFDLFGFELSVPPNFCGLKRLIDLRLVEVSFEAGGFESLISGCPLLEKLNISFCSGFECIDLSSPTLKVVCINFENNIKSISLKNAKNLIDLTLADHGDDDTLVDHGDEEDESVKVFGLVKSLPKLQRLVMRSYDFKILSAGGVIRETLLESLSSLEYLKLDGMDLCEREGLLYTFGLLKSTHNLVELVIESHEYSDYVGQQEPDQLEELECDGCCLGQLRTVKIGIRYRFKYALSLIRFILANCPLLETLSFDTALGLKQSEATVLLSMSQDLIRMKRASQKVQVEFTHMFCPM